MISQTAIDSFNGAELQSRKDGKQKQANKTQELTPKTVLIERSKYMHPTYERKQKKKEWT